MNPFDLGYYGSDQLAGFGFASVGKNVLVAKNCTIIGLHNVCLGDNVRIDGNVVMAAANGRITIGNYVHVAGFCFLGAGGGITMEDFSGLSHGVRLYSTSDDYSGESLTNPTVPSRYRRPSVAPVRLCRHVIIGAGSVVLPGCELGEGSAVGSLSLVTKSLAPWGIYFGAPARRLRSRSMELVKLEAALRAEQDS